jgi:WD40 repeat protein
MRLVLNLCEWQFFRMISALALSLSAVTFFAVTVSLVLLPADYERLRQPLYLSITHCHPIPQSEQVLSLVWYMPRRDAEGWRHQILRHDLRGQRPKLEMAWPGLSPSSMGAGPAGKVVYAGCWDGVVWRIDPSRPDAPPERVGAHSEQAPHIVACSADGRWLATLGPNVLQVLELETGRVAWQLGGGQVRCVAAHPHQSVLAVSLTSGELIELDMRTGERLRSLAAFSEPSLNIAFSSDGRLAAIIATGGGIELLDWQSGKSALPPGWQDNRHYIRAGIAVFSPDGKKLITGGEDTAKLAVWDVSTMRCEGELGGHDKAINGAVFLDERRLCSFAADGTIRMWDVTSSSTLRVLTIDVTSQAG